MKRRGNHITVTLALATLLILSSCTRNASFSPVSLLVGEGSKSTVISTVLLRLPGRLIDETVSQVENHFLKNKHKQKKTENRKASEKILSLPIHTRIANPIPFKKDNKTDNQTKESDNNSHSNTSGNTKLETETNQNTTTKTQDVAVDCQLM